MNTPSSALDATCRETMGWPVGVYPILVRALVVRGKLASEPTSFREVEHEGWWG
jgi:hypothetical protein